MKKITIKEITIANEKFDYVNQIKSKINYFKWVQFIELNLHYFTWLENTPKGDEMTQNINLFSVEFQNGIKQKLNKTQALAEFNSEKKFHEFVIDFHNDYGIITTNFECRIKKKHLIILLNMANYLDALLLNHGTQIIDEKVIENYK